MREVPSYIRVAAVSFPLCAGNEEFVLDIVDREKVRPSWCIMDLVLVAAAVEEKRVSLGFWSLCCGNTHKAVHMTNSWQRGEETR